MNYKNDGAEQPSCVLLCGNTRILDYESIKTISRYYKVIVSSEDGIAGNIRKLPSKDIHIYREDPTSDNFSRILYSYSPGAVWYFSGYMDGGNGLTNENKKFESLVSRCVANDIKKLIVVSSVNSLNYIPVDDKEGHSEIFENNIAYNSAAFEKLVDFTASKDNIKTVVLRVPFIAGRVNKDNYLGGLFEHLINKKDIKIPYNSKQQVDFLSVDDLVKLLVSVTEETLDEAGAYTVLSGYSHTYNDLGEELKKCENDAVVDYDDPSVYRLTADEKNERIKLKHNYGFIAADDSLTGIEELYKEYKNSNNVKSPIIMKISGFFKRFSDNTLKVAELILLFILIQFLLGYTSDSVYFRYVDLRLFYVVIIGVTHGMLMGILSGVLACISLIMAYADTGVTGVMLFYNVDYWLPFAIYMMTGAITGYLTGTKNNKIKFMEEESYALQDKYLFLNRVYMSVIDNKEEYKRQILGYQDSFGKIFEAVENLDSSTPAEIFMNGVDTLEHILNNRSIGIYSMDEHQKFLRLVACSREMTPKLANSVSIHDFKIIYDKILTQDTWKNTEFGEGLPIYSYGIVENGMVRLMICVFDATPEQMGLYYMNLFTIMCNLIRVSFRRALEYQEAIEDEKFYAGTEILIPEYFIKELEFQRKMSDAGVASYVLVCIDTDNVLSLDKKLQRLIRHSDFVGIGEDNKPYLLLTQTSGEMFDKVGMRLKDNGIGYTIVEGL